MTPRWNTTRGDLWSYRNSLLEATDSLSADSFEVEVPVDRTAYREDSAVELARWIELTRSQVPERAIEVVLERSTTGALEFLASSDAIQWEPSSHAPQVVRILLSGYERSSE